MKNRQFKIWQNLQKMQILPRFWWAKNLKSFVILVCLVFWQNLNANQNPPKTHLSQSTKQYQKSANSTDCTKKHCPKSRDELIKLINDLSVNLSEIDTQHITDMSFLFANVGYFGKCSKNNGIYFYENLEPRLVQNCDNTGFERFKKMNERLKSSVDFEAYQNLATKVKPLEDLIKSEQECKKDFVSFVASKAQAKIHSKEYAYQYGSKHKVAVLTKAQKEQITQEIANEYKSCVFATDKQRQTLSYLLPKYQALEARFYRAKQNLLDEMGNIEKWNVSNVEDFSFMFYRFGNYDYETESKDAKSKHRNIIEKNEFLLENLIGDFSQWDISGAKSLRAIFAAREDNYINPKGVEKWDTQNVKDMGRAFEYSAFDGNLNQWNVSKVEKMDFMFYNNRAFNSPLDSWDTSSATTMEGMFGGADLFDQNIENWNVGNVKNMKYMFSNANQSEGNFYQMKFNQPLEKWNVSNVEDMSSMFSFGVFNQPLNKWNVSKVKSMAFMFAYNNDFDQHIDKWRVESVQSFYNMFELDIKKHKKQLMARIKDARFWGKYIGKRVEGGIKNTDFDKMFGDVDFLEINGYKNLAIELDKKRGDIYDKCVKTYHSQTKKSKEFINAVINRNYEGAKKIYAKNAKSNKVDINARDVNCDTALHIVLDDENYDMDFIKFLLANGADIALPTRNNKYALDIVIKAHLLLSEDYQKKKDETYQVAKMLLEYGASTQKALALSVQEKRDDIVALLLEYGVMIGKDEAFYLHYALKNAVDKYTNVAFYHIAELLIANGADTKIKNNNGKDALQIAQENLQKFQKYKHINSDMERIIELIKRARQKINGRV